MQIQSDLKRKELRNWSKKIINEIRSDFRIVPLNSLKTSKYFLKKPLIILLERDGNQYIASLDDVEVFVVSDTEYEAIDGICEEIVQLYEDLLDSSHRLGPLPLRWYQFLNDYIEKR